MNIKSSEELLNTLSDYNKRSANTAKSNSENHQIMQCVILTHMLAILIGVYKHLDNGIKFDTTSPSNVYGEGLVDGIQNAIERGQRGINTNG